MSRSLPMIVDLIDRILTANEMGKPDAGAELIPNILDSYTDAGMIAINLSHQALSYYLAGKRSETTIHGAVVKGFVVPLRNMLNSKSLDFTDVFRDGKIPDIVEAVKVCLCD